MKLIGDPDARSCSAATGAEVSAAVQGLLGCPSRPLWLTGRVHLQVYMAAGPRRSDSERSKCVCKPRRSAATWRRVCLYRKHHHNGASLDSARARGASSLAPGPKMSPRVRKTINRALLSVIVVVTTVSLGLLALTAWAVRRRLTRRRRTGTTPDKVRALQHFTCYARVAWHGM
jgi:hypothetical protein